MRDTDGLKGAIFVFKLLGYWELNTEKSWVKFLNKFHCNICKVSLFVLVILEIVYLRNVTKFESALEVMFILALMASIFQKQWNFSRNYERLKLLYEHLDYELFSSNSDEEQRYLRRATFLAKTIFRLMISMGFITYIGFIAFSLTDPKGSNLIILAESPIDLKQRNNFIWVYLFQVWICTYCVLINLSIDCFGFGLVIQYNSKLQCLLYQISRVGIDDTGDFEYRENCLNVTPTPVDTKENIWRQLRLVKYKAQNAYYENGPIYGRVYKCALLHQVIYESCKELEDFFQTPIFILITIGGFILCSAAFQLQTMPLMSVKFLTIIGYIIVMLFQIWVPCTTGNDLIYNSTMLARKGFEGRIEKLDRKSSKLLLMFMQRSQIPIEIKAGGIFKITLHLANYMSILKSCYSFFALMQSIGEKE